MKEGEVEGAAKGDKVRTRLLLDVCHDAGLTRIDALKIDIEGREKRALEPFFDHAPRALWPEMLLVETGRAGQPKLTAMLRHCGYEVEQRLEMITILRLPGRS